IAISDAILNCFMDHSSSLVHGEQRRHRRYVRGVAGELQATESKRALKGLQQRKVVVGSRVLKTARSVAGDHDRSHLTSAGIGIAAAAGIAVGALIKGNYDGIVAFRPEPRAGDLLNHRAHKVVAEGDQLLILWVAWSAAIDAIGGRTVHVIALIRDDISEIGNVPLGQVVVELLDRPHLGKLSVAGLNTHEIRNTVVLRGVEG